jgi:hypothetical protein
MLRLVQLFDTDGERRVGVAGEDAARLQLIGGFTRVYEMAQAAIREGVSLEHLARAYLSSHEIDYAQAVAERRLLTPFDHADPARCIVSLTGLTHLGSATSRDQMHTAVAAGTATDSIRMFQIGVEGSLPYRKDVRKGGGEMSTRHA